MLRTRNLDRPSPNGVESKPPSSGIEELATGMLASLLAEYRTGCSLPGGFYNAPEIYDTDLKQIWGRGWLFAGHSCEIFNPGDFFTLQVGTDSLVILRDEKMVVRCLHNVCRHRGSLILTGTDGHTNQLVCPYHQWTYGLGGELLACRGMQETLDKSEFHLPSAHVREFGGLIFINLAAEPPDFEKACGEFLPVIQPQGLTRAKVAQAIDYLVPANWKLIWENNRECYHCNLNHPHYTRANFDHYDANDTPFEIQAQLAQSLQSSEQQVASSGLASICPQMGMTKFPDAENGAWFFANRTPLADGYASETMNGKPVAPLMGDYRASNVGTLRMRGLPNFWNHSSCDHSVTTRLLPVGPQLTAVRVWWLVDIQAIEGRDYHLEQLLPFWQLTSEQDWEICKNQQRGVNSSAYSPGPYSIYKEYNVESFIQWYLKLLQKNEC